MYANYPKYLIRYRKVWRRRIARKIFNVSNFEIAAECLNIFGISDVADAVATRNLSAFQTSNKVEATLSNAASWTIRSTKSNVASTKSNVASTFLPFLATMSNEFFREISSFRQSRNKLNMFSLFRLCRKDKISFDIVAKNGNNVEAINVRLCPVDRIVRLVAFDNVASTLLLVWTGLYIDWFVKRYASNTNVGLVYENVLFLVYSKVFFQFFIFYFLYHVLPISANKDVCCVCRQAVKEFVDVLVHDQSALGARPLLPAASALPAAVTPLDSTVQRHLSQFSLVTHGFGAPAIVAAMSAVQNYLNELLKCVDRSAEFHYAAGVDQWTGQLAVSRPLCLSATVIDSFSFAENRHVVITVASSCVQNNQYRHKTCNKGTFLNRIQPSPYICVTKFRFLPLLVQLLTAYRRIDSKLIIKVLFYMQTTVS